MNSYIDPIASNQKRGKMQACLAILLNLLSFVVMTVGFFLPRIYLFFLGFAVVLSIVALVVGISAADNTAKSKLAIAAVVLSIVAVTLTSLVFAVSAYIEYWFWKHPIEGPLVPIPVGLLLRLFQL